MRCLVTAMDSSGDGTITLKEFASFLNLDDHEPLYQPLFDGRRRNVNIMQARKKGRKQGRQGYNTTNCVGESRKNNIEVDYSAPPRPPLVPLNLTTVVLR